MKRRLAAIVTVAALPMLAAEPARAVESWGYVEVDAARGKWGDFTEPEWLRYFGIDAADMDGDGDLDVVSGRYVYRNPGGVMEAWERLDVGANVDGMVAVDVDRDEDADFIAQALPEVVWMEAEGPDLRTWRRTVIGQLPKTGHTNGQGYGAGDLDGDGRPEVLLTAADGIYASPIPEEPAAGAWPWVRVVSRGTDEGFAVMDMDGDGDADLVGGDGPPGDEEPTLVVWWANPGSLAGDWPKHVVGETVHAVDRVVAVDLNDDGRTDVAVSEERYPGKEPDAHLWWFEATAEPTAAFERHLLVEQYSMNNLDAGDIDGDGDVDLVTNEHKGPHLRAQVFENDGKGAFTLREIGQGRECHLGMRLFDLDADGDLDIVGPAWDNHRFLHLWRNDRVAGLAAEEDRDVTWGERTLVLRAEDAERGQLFDEGNYAMFIHWGLYSQLANKVGEKTHYGIGEWIMHPRMAGIPVEEYRQLADTFNPTKFDAEAIARLAKEAGMKYIVITSKHHDGFAMYHSRASDFNIVDSTPWKKDPMKELATACREAGLGFGFYYSHNQDWTFPGASGGPKVDENGKAASFDDYFVEKCLPQVEEITTGYGPIELVWFDTPGKMPKTYVQQLVDVVRRNQPHALVSGRAGHGLGDYDTLGDMEVPSRNVEGLWESVDTTNDSWAYAWYDENWKTPKEILHRLIASVGRGGTYMLNIGPRGDGSVPERAARSLRESGEWIRRHPQVVYATGASPWGHAQPWGDITARGNRLFLSVFEWPASGRLYLPGLKTRIRAARLLTREEAEPVAHQRRHGWTVFQLPSRAPEELAWVVEVELAGAPEVEATFGIDPDLGAEILAAFATVEGAELSQKRWMEKFGEWKSVHHAHNWTSGGEAAWDVAVLEPGDHMVSLTYSGEGRLVWGVGVQGGEHIQNEQSSSHNYQEFPMGWVSFPEPGDYRVAVSCLEGACATSSLKAIRITPVQ